MQPACLSVGSGGCRYDRQRCEAKQIKDMQLMAAMAPPGGGRNAFSQRLQVSPSLMHVCMQLCCPGPCGLTVIKLDKKMCLVQSNSF